MHQTFINILVFYTPNHLSHFNFKTIVAHLISQGTTDLSDTNGNLNNLSQFLNY